MPLGALAYRTVDMRGSGLFVASAPPALVECRLFPLLGWDSFALPMFPALLSSEFPENGREFSESPDVASRYTLSHIAATRVAKSSGQRR